MRLTEEQDKYIRDKVFEAIPTLEYLWLYIDKYINGLIEVCVRHRHIGYCTEYQWFCVDEQAINDLDIMTYAIIDICRHSMNVTPEELKKRYRYETRRE